MKSKQNNAIWIFLLFVSWMNHSHALQPEPNAVFARVIDSGAALCVVVAMPGDHYMIYDAGNYVGGGVAYAQAARCRSGGSPTAGACRDGGTATGNLCKSGNTAGERCRAGTIAAGGRCRAGGTPAQQPRCKTGGSAANLCRAGSTAGGRCKAGATPV